MHGTGSNIVATPYSHVKTALWGDDAINTVCIGTCPYMRHPLALAADAATSLALPFM
jgi:hypothetical protein